MNGSFIFNSYGVYDLQRYTDASKQRCGYGVETYKEMMQMRRDIRAKRERIIYKQRRRQRRMLDVSAIILALMFSGGIVYATVSVIRSAG